MEVKSSRSASLDTPSLSRGCRPNILKADVSTMVRRSLVNAAKKDAAVACGRPGPRPGLRALLDRNAVELVEPDAPDVAVVVLGEASNPLRSPPLDQPASNPRHVVELPSEEDAGVETPPPADAQHPLTDHNYEVTFKVETDEMLSDMDDEGVPVEPARARSPPLPTNVVTIRKDVDNENEEVDVVEFEDEVEAAMSALFAETPATPARAADTRVKTETSSPATPETPQAQAVSEPASPVASTPGKALRPGWRECPICGVAVMGVMGYRDHMLARHMTAKPYRCLACWKTFSLAKDLIRHTNNNCTEVMYKCQRCDRVWSSDLHHAACEACAAAGGDGPEEDKDRDASYQCAVCSRSFPLLRHLSSHVKTHPDVDKPFKCHSCGHLFRQSVRLMIHVRSHLMSPSKSGLARTRTPAPSPAAKRARVAGPGPGNGVPHGPLTYANPAFILKMEPPEPHSDDEFAERPGAFDDDDFHDDVFRGAVGFDDEDDDDEDVDDEDDADAENAPEDPERLMDLDGEEAGDGASLKRYKCKWCSKTFRFSHQVGIHMRTHTGERPYCCRLCHTQFRQSNHLKRHLCMSHGLVGAAANQAFRSMIALKRRRQQRERFRALTAFFAKQGGFKGFGPAVEGDAEVDKIINRGFAKDLCGRGMAGKKARDDHYQRVGNPAAAKPWIKFGQVNGQGSSPSAAGSAASCSPEAPAATARPSPGPRHSENGTPS